MYSPTDRGFPLNNSILVDCERTALYSDQLPRLLTKRIYLLSNNQLRQRV